MPGEEDGVNVQAPLSPLPSRSSFDVTRSRSAFDAPRSRVRRQPRDAAQGADQGLPRVRRADEIDSIDSRNPRDVECGDNLLNGDEMKTEAQSHNRDGKATTVRSPLALFVVAELLCAGALVAWVVLWM